MTLEAPQNAQDGAGETDIAGIPAPPSIPRKSGRPKGYPKTGGRVKETPDLSAARSRLQTLVLQGMCDVLEGKPRYLRPDQGPGKPMWLVPSGKEFIQVLTAGLGVSAAALRATEITGKDGQPLNPAVEQKPVDNRELAKILAPMIAGSPGGRELLDAIAAAQKAGPGHKVTITPKNKTLFAMDDPSLGVALGGHRFDADGTNSAEVRTAVFPHEQPRRPHRRERRAHGHARPARRRMGPGRRVGSLGRLHAERGPREVRYLPRHRPAFGIPRQPREGDCARRATHRRREGRRPPETEDHDMTTTKHSLRELRNMIADEGRKSAAWAQLADELDEAGKATRLVGAKTAELASVDAQIEAARGRLADAERERGEILADARAEADRLKAAADAHAVAAEATRRKADAALVSAMGEADRIVAEAKAEAQRVDEAVAAIRKAAR